MILITNHYIGYGSSGRAADGSKLAEYPLSFVLLKFQKNDAGDWKGVGRLFVGAKVRFDSGGKKFVIDEFPTRSRLSQRREDQVTRSPSPE